MTRSASPLEGKTTNQESRMREIRLSGSEGYRILTFD